MTALQQMVAGGHEVDAVSPTDLELTSVWPNYMDGTVLSTVQFTAGSCYACSDSAWSAYTVSTQVVLPEVSIWFEASRGLPAPVLGLLEGQIGGATVIDSVLRSKLLAEFGAAEL